MSRFQAQAVVSYLRRLHAGAAAPDRVRGDAAGGDDLRQHLRDVPQDRRRGRHARPRPDARRQAGATPKAIREVIEDASMVYGESVMPVFKERLSAEQMSALVTYLASRK